MVDHFVIGIALLIFGYGIYELVISDLVHTLRVVQSNTPTFSR
ncbi:YqhA family protein [Synechococcus sp. MU1642]|nr:YqhA family protein [Synechococcus sp. MU1642]MCB4406679.1 YqhA family protein [Synechococcus sp. MU1642]